MAVDATTLQELLKETDVEMDLGWLNPGTAGGLDIKPLTHGQVEQDRFILWGSGASRKFVGEGPRPIPPGQAESTCQVGAGCTDTSSQDDRLLPYVEH